MAISGMLNRPVRARLGDDDEVYSEESDEGEEVSQDEGEEDEDSDANLSDLVCHDLLPIASRE